MLTTQWAGEAVPRFLRLGNRSTFVRPRVLFTDLIGLLSPAKEPRQGPEIEERIFLQLNRYCPQGCGFPEANKQLSSHTARLQKWIW